MRLLKKYRSFIDLTRAFLPEKEIQVCRKAYLSYTRASFVFNEWSGTAGLPEVDYSH